MVLTSARNAPAGAREGDREVSLGRLYALRAMFLVWIIGGFFMALPPLLDHEPTARGMLPSMLSGLWVLGFVGLRYPLQMLPIFLFEFVWKTIWMLVFGLPQWLRGLPTPQLKEDLLSMGTGPLLFGLIIPWGYVYRHYVKQPADRWR